MSDVCRSLNEDMTQARNHFILDVICIHEGLSVVLPNGTHLGQLNMHLADALVDHVRSQNIRLEALVLKKSIFE
jgi:hypothetical protein